MAAGTRDLTTPSRSSNNKQYIVKPQTIRRVFSYADVVAVKGSAMEANEVVQLIDVAAGDVILGVRLFVLTQGTSGVTIDIGDGDDVDRFLDGADANGAAGSMSGVPGVAFKNADTAPYNLTGGYCYAAADTIDAKFLGGAETAGKFMLEVDMISIAAHV